MKSSAPRSSTNKSDAIRSYKAQHPDAGPKAISDALAAEGISVKPTFISTLMFNDRRKGRSDGSVDAATRGASDTSVESLIQAKQLADRLGGIDKARQAMDILAKLLG